MISGIIDAWGEAIFRASWQGGLVLLTVWVICLMFSRVSPGVKCWLWRLGFLKFMTAFLLMGAIALPLLPARKVVPEVEKAAEAAKGMGEKPVVADRAGERARVAIMPAGGRPVGNVESATSGATERSAGAVVEKEIVNRAPGAVVEKLKAPWGQYVKRAVFGVWVLGVMGCGGIVFTAWLRTRAARLGARAVEDGDWKRTLERLAEGMGVGRAPELLVSEGAGGPVLIGVLRPAILIPPFLLEEECREGLRLALAHELAHIRRRDIFWNLMQRLVESVFFFHPLIWLARRQPQYWQELACDRMALESTQASPMVYGHALLGIIERQRDQGQLMHWGVGVAESVNTLRRRLIAMTTFRQRTRGGVLMAVLLMGLVIGGIPSWRLTERSARGGEPRATDNLAEETLTVKVLDEAGKAIEGASLIVRMPGSRSEQATTSKEGLAMFKLEEGATGIFVEAKAQGKTPAVWRWSQTELMEKTPNRATIRMDEATQIGGIVVDEKGQPIAEAHVVLRVVKNYSEPGQRVNINYESTQTDGNGKWTYYGVPAECDEINIGTWSYLHLGRDAIFSLENFKDKAALRAGTAKLTMLKGTPIHIKVVDAEGNPLSGATVAYGDSGGAVNVVPSPRANGDGVVELGVVPGATAILTAMARGYAPDQKRVSVEKSALEVKFELERAKPLTGKVVDRDGKPIPGVTLRVDKWRDARPFSDVRFTSREDGTFTWADAPADLLNVDVVRNGNYELQMLMKVGEENRVVMDGPTTLFGTVVDAETGKPIEAFTIVEGVDYGHGRPENISWQRSNGKVGQGKNGVFEWNFAPYEEKWKVRVEAKGYLPADSDLISGDKKRHEFTFKLVKGKPITGEVVDADGKPVKQAKVMLLVQSSRPQVLNNRVDVRNGKETIQTTDADGKFLFDPRNEKYGVAIFADEGYAMLNQEELQKTEKIVLTKWATVEGDVFVGTERAAMSTVSIDYWDLKFGNPNQPAYSSPYLLQYHQVQADVSGKFIAERVMAGKMTVHRQVEIGDRRYGYSGDQVVTLKAGERVKVKVGGTGRPVVGKAEIPAELQKAGFVVKASELRASLDFPKKTEMPAEIRRASVEERNKWEEEWKKSEEGRAYEQAMEKIREIQRFYPAVVKTDGRFRADDVPAGTYELVIALGSRTSDESPVPTEDKDIVYGMARVTVPEITGGASEEPMEIGTVKLIKWPNIKVGDPAPLFAIKTLDGKDLKLEDFRGKYVVLDFWATWCKPCLEEIPEMKKVWEAHGKDPRFAMIGLSLDTEAKTAETYVKEEEMGWTHGFLGNGREPDAVSIAYGVNGIPNVWLIGPDGKVMAKGLRGADVGEAVKRALK